MLLESLEIFRKLTSLGEKIYLGISDVDPVLPIVIESSKMPYHWKDILPVYEEEYKKATVAYNLASSGKHKESINATGVIIGKIVKD